MPALAKPSLWASVAKEIPALVARQLEDNKPSTVTLLSSGKAWYKHEAFWIPVAIIGGIALLVCIGLGAVSGKEREYVDPAEYKAARAAEAAEAAEDERWMKEARKRQDEWWGKHGKEYCRVANEMHAGRLLSERKKKQRELRGWGLIKDQATQV